MGYVQPQMTSRRSPELRGNAAHTEPGCRDNVWAALSAATLRSAAGYGMRGHEITDP